MSAYACRPGKGSEHEIGWQWALHMARWHDVTVFTRAKNRPIIEEELRRTHAEPPLPNFKYHDLKGPWLRWKSRFDFFRVYYIAWQRSARAKIKALLSEERFDLLHHVTFSSYRYPTAIWGHEAPTIWGPVGGIESVPPAFMPVRDPKALFYEVVRGTTNITQNLRAGMLFRRARATDLTLVCTNEMMQLLARLGVEGKLMPSAGMPPGRFPKRKLSLREGPLRMLYVGNIIPLKGLDLALEALAASQTDAHFTLIGDGDFLEPARALTFKLGLKERVDFKGRLPQSATLAAYPDFDMLIFPSLHDTGGFAVLEAMSNYLPVICLDVGGPGVMVNSQCGFKAPLGERAAVVQELAAAIRAYDGNRELLRQHAEAARERVLQDFNWERKAEKMDAYYREVTERARARGQSSLFSPK